MQYCPLQWSNNDRSDSAQVRSKFQVMGHVQAVGIITAVEGLLIVPDSLASLRRRQGARFFSLIASYSEFGIRVL